jgi:spore germination protein
MPRARWIDGGLCLVLTACGASASTSTSTFTIRDGGSDPTLDAGALDAAPTGTGDDAETPPSTSDAATSFETGGDDAGGDIGTDAAAPATKTVALGYYTGTHGSYSALMAHASYVNAVSSDVFLVHATGVVDGTDDNAANAFARSQGATSYACISSYNGAIGDFDPAIGHAATVTYKTQVIAAAMKLAQTGYDGINIDFESIAYSANVADDRAAYSSFIHDLASALHAVGLKLIISVPGKTADDPSNTWSYPYDFAALGADVDGLQLMTYDENGPGWSGPGPVSGADWVEKCVQYALTVAPKEKILIGLPAYGYDWDLTQSKSSGTNVGTSVTWTAFGKALGTSGAVKHWDMATSSPYVDYTASDGHAHELWYEDAKSIATKTALVPKYGIAGYSMWALGDEDESFCAAAKMGAP